MEIIDLVNNKDITKLSEVFEPLIKKWIKKYNWSHIDKEDLQQESIFAVMNAVKYYNPNARASFGKYLEYWLHYYLGQYVLRNVNLIRPAADYLASSSSVLSDIRKKAIDDYHNFSYVEIDNPDCACQLTYNPEDNDRAICSKELNKFAKSVLPKRAYNILYSRCDEKSLSQLGKEYSLSRERIRQIELFAIDKIRKKLGISENGTEKFI